MASQPQGMASQQQKEQEDGGVVNSKKVLANVTMDLDVLDCPVCCHPLRPPIFQCTVGHTICSPCHDKLPDKLPGKCYFCSGASVYSRCHMVELIIESIKVACSNVNQGCTERITYYQKDDHEKGCPHTPCFCPEADCSFRGSTMMLLDHFSSKHKWLSAEIRYDTTLAFRLQAGSMVVVGQDGHLFLVNMVLNPLGGVISVCCIQPHITGPKFRCRLTLSRQEPSYSQSTEFMVRSTNLHDGMPEDCNLIVVPKQLLSTTGASAIAKVGMVCSLELRPLRKLLPNMVQGGIL